LGYWERAYAGPVDVCVSDWKIFARLVLHLYVDMRACSIT